MGWFAKSLRWIARQPLFRQPFMDILHCLERSMRAPTAFRAMAPMILVMIPAWFVYVPIHELLHAYGCTWTGGEVTQLEISPQYGAVWLQKIFPFVTTGSDYAGRLSGFDTKESDFCYFITVFLPFALTIFIGVPLIRICARKKHAFLLGVAIVVGLAPFYNMPGDYYEMASILVTRALTTLQGGGYPAAFAGIRADDIYLLAEQFLMEPSKLGLETGTDRVVGFFLIGLGLIVDLLLAFLTYWAGGKFADLLFGRRNRAAQPA